MFDGTKSSLCNLIYQKLKITIAVLLLCFKSGQFCWNTFLQIGISKYLTLTFVNFLSAR